MEENTISAQTPVWWSSVWEAVADAIVVLDEKGCIEDCNRATEGLFGYTRSETVGRSLDALIPDLRPVVQSDGMQKYVEDCKAVPANSAMEYVARMKDGSDLPVNLKFGDYSFRERSGFVCIVHDMSTRKQIEDRLQQREEQLKLTIKHAPIGMATLDLDGNIITVNEAFGAMVGYTEKELLHKPVNSITHQDDIDAAEMRLRQLRNGEIDQYRMRKRYVRKDGTVVESILSASVVHGPKGAPLLYVAQVEDLTDRLKAERDASEIREKLAHVTRVHMIGEMAAGIAHEINQPLAAIATYAQASRRMIEGGMVASDEVLDAMNKISRQARRAGEVIASLRSLVRKRSSTRREVDVDRLIRDVVQLAEMDSRMCDTSINLDLESGLPRVLADPVQIQQVILNLLLNGIEAMGCPDCPDKSLTVSAKLAVDHSVQISVKDQGAGISQEAEDSMFRSFFTTKESGMGMGLVISRSILNAHGGSLWFTRNPNEGTTFHLSIPVSAGEME
jgi:two-component system sensor kinase FixL